VPEPQPNDNRERRFGYGNNLRIDLYRALIPQIIEEDQKSGHVGPVLFWNDPNAAWNGGRVQDVWNSIGLAPVWQTLFYVLETMEGEEIDILESLDFLVDPWECPEELLDDLAASFGYRLKQSLSEEAKRTIVAGLFHAYKSLGQFNGFRAFYRMVGFEIVRVFPLWKKDIFEERNDYSRSRYATSQVTAEPVGPAGVQVFATILSSLPIKPGTVRFSDGGVVVARDLPPSHWPEGLSVTAPEGEIVGATGVIGSINYATGSITMDLGAPAVGAVTSDYEQITEEWPYHAARIDLEIQMNPGGGVIPVVDGEVVSDLLVRLDEVRPIHVLLRAMTLVFELTDDVTPAATDLVACTEFLKDVRDGLANPPEPGLDHTVTIDQAPVAEDGGLSIEEIVAGNTTVWRQELEDRTGFVCPLLDVLTIDTNGGSPNEGVY
jgi:hypothetical protein